MKFTIIDYGIGNLLSIIKSFEKNGIDLHLSRDNKTIKNSSGLILPGVGAFGTAVKTLHHLNLFDEIKSFVKTGKPVLGICLGMQLFMSKSYEFGENIGLNLIDGTVEKIKIDTDFQKFKLPHIGWREVNEFNSPNNSSAYFKSIFNKKFYFVHSYESKPNDKKYIFGNCKYFNTQINAIIQKENIIGCQFHPEKSGKNGLKFIESFINFAKKI